MQERRVNMRAGRARPFVPEPYPTDDSAYWSAVEPVSETPSRPRAASAPRRETYVERVWNLAKGTISDLLRLNPSEPPLRQRRTEGDEASRSAARDDSRRYRDENSVLSESASEPYPAQTNQRPSTGTYMPFADSLATTTTQSAPAPAPAAAAPASNITVYQFYAAPSAPNFYPPVSGQTVPNSSSADLFVPRVSLLSRPVLTYSGQKRPRPQDRPLTPLEVPSLNALNQPSRPAQPQAAQTAKPLSLNVSTTAPIAVKPAVTTTTLGTTSPAPPAKAATWASSNTFGSTPAPAAAGSTNPFEAAPSATAPVPAAAPASGTPAKFNFGSAPAPAPAKTTTAPPVKPAENSFFKAGPPVDMFEEDGFASNADSSDGEQDVPTPTPAAAKPAFTFGASNPFGSTPAPASGASANPFGAPSATAPVPAAAPASGTPAKFNFGSAPAPAPAKTTTAPPVKPAENSFFKSGPPVDMFEEDGFASNADSSDGEDKPTPKPSETPEKPVFSFGTTPSAANSSGSTAARPANPGNPFSFGIQSTTAVKPAFGSSNAAPAWGSPATDDKKDAEVKSATVPFSFGLSTSTTNVKSAF